MDTSTEDVDAEDGSGGRTRRVIWCSVFGGALLALIGLRFFLVPSDAAATFGLAPQLKGYELHHVIALRDLWLGGLAIAFALLKEWRALALWMGFAVVCCLLDSIIAANSSGNSWAIGFHLGSALFCLLVGRGAWILHKERAEADLT